MAETCILADRDRRAPGRASERSDLDPVERL
jgi:hypothetical protein